MAHSDRMAMKGLGAATPQKVLTNFDLEKMVDTSDEWIRSRTGIERRHVCDNGDSTLSLAYEASRKALDDAGVTPDQLGMILFATVTPELGFPATACLLQDMLGAKNAASMDFMAACSGFIYGLHLADALIRGGAHEYILLVGAESFSRIVNWEDRDTCVLFGDGAGAAVLGRSDDPDRGIISTFVQSDGANPEMLMCIAGGTREIKSHEEQFVTMAGRELFKKAVTAMGDAADDSLASAGYTSDDLSLLIPHQANTRIIEATAKRIKLPMEKVFLNIQEYGNTSAATIPICLPEARETGRMKQGDLVLMVAFGAGLTWGSALMRY
jgi:3-oxoacyl-[acyl-carrier-protein] synthase III